LGERRVIEGSARKIAVSVEDSLPVRSVFRDRTEVDLDCFYFVSLEGEEFRVPGAGATFDFCLVENEGFVAFFKQLFDAKGRRFLAIICRQASNAHTPNNIRTERSSVLYCVCA
jgi:hypothetical protein